VTTHAVAVIVNPVKVADLALLKTEVSARAVAAGLGEPLWVETTQDDPGAGMVAEALHAAARLVLVCGGDGTVAACAGALAGTDAAMAVIPAGTGNLLARNLGLPLAQADALDIAFGTGRRTIDVLEAGGTRFVVMAGLGFDAALIRDTDEDFKSKVGWLAYLGGLVRALRGSPHAYFSVAMDGGDTVRHRGVGVLVGNVGQLQGGVAVLSDAEPDDGLLDVIVLTPRMLRDWPVLLWRVLRRRAHIGEQAQVSRGTSVQISVDRPLPVEYDGEFEGEATTLSVSVLAGALQVCTGER
jgi:diacylglycerol kinase family enzyme